MSSDERIVEVWSGNLEEEFDCIRRVVRDYPFVSMVRRESALVWPCMSSQPAYALSTRTQSFLA